MGKNIAIHVEILSVFIFFCCFKFQIKDAKTFFLWMDQYFLPNYYPVLEYNGKRLHWSVRQFVTDGVSFRVGPAMLRQLRSKTGKLYP